MTTQITSLQRVRPLTDEELLADPAVLQAFDELDVLDVRPTSALRVMAHQPAICAPWFRLAAAFNFHSVLPDQDREQVVLRVAHRRRCATVWGFHELLARRAGLTIRQIERISCQPVGEEPSDADALLIVCTDEILDHARLDADLFERLRDRYSDAQLVELPLAVRFFDANCSFVETLAITADE